MGFQFTPSNGLLNTTTFPTTPVNETAARQQFMTVFDQIKDEMNSGATSAIGLDAMSRQALINGNFDIWQRGTSFTNPTNLQYTADRFYSNYGASGTLPTSIIHSKQTLAPGDIQGSYTFYRISPNGAGSGFGVNDGYTIGHKIENGTRYLCGNSKKVTVSFWAKSSIVGKKIGVYFTQNYGTGGSPTASETINGNNFTLTSSWTKYTVTVTTNTLVGKTFGTNNDDWLSVSLAVMWGTGGYGVAVGASGSSESFVGAGDIDIAQVQVCAGDQALPFQPRSYIEELRNCHRYTYALTSSETEFPIGYGFAATTSVVYIGVELPGEMRVNPSLIATATDWRLLDGIAAVDLSAISIQTNQNGKQFVTLRCTGSSLTQFRPYSLNADVTSNRILIFDAEL